MKKSVLVLLLSLFVFSYVFAADTTINVNPVGTATQSSSLSVRDWTKGISGTLVLSAQTAMAAPVYPVTPGDVYAISMVVEGTMVSYSIVVDNTNKLKILNLAVVDATGKTYTELKTQVESILGKNYPMQGTVFLLSNPGVFKVLVKGEVTQTMELNAWGLSRLSQTVSTVLTDYSSIRDITVTSANGKSKTYDLFQATRFGDLSQDPFLKPGDSITIARSKRTVTVTGPVERPGAYQLLDGENLKDLVKLYGSGLTKLADTERIDLVRYLDGNSKPATKISLTGKDIDENYELKDFDTVSIGTTTDLQPTMFIEGAIGVTAGATTQTSVRKAVQFNPGENYASFIRTNKSLFSAISDTVNAYIIRGDKNIPVDLTPMLYDNAFNSDLTVERDDFLVVPFKQYFVTVKGAVVSPGRYPFIPGRKAEYYVNLAGGINPELNTLGTMGITDVKGKRLNKSNEIPPESTVYVYKNSWLYYFNLYSPVVLTTCSIITTYFATRAVLEANK